MAKKSTLSAGERSQLVMRLLSKEAPAAQIARRAGVSEQTLNRWRDEFLSAGKQALAGRGADREQAKELRQLKSALTEREQVIGEITMRAGRLIRP
jgi:transposase